MKTLPKLLILPALLASAAALNAGTVTFSDLVSMPNNTDITILIKKFDTVNDIDTAAGTANSTVGATLTGVTITVKTLVSGASVQLDNDSGSAQTGSGLVTNQVNSYNSSVDDFVIAAIDLQINESQDFALDPTSGDAVGVYNNTSDTDHASWSPGTLEGADSGAVNSAFFAGFTTTTLDETISYTINSTYSTSATFDGELGYFQGNTPSGQFFVEVTYDYSAAPAPVPEPSTYGALLGLAVLGFVGTRRRR